MLSPSKVTIEKALIKKFVILLCKQYTHYNISPKYARDARDAHIQIQINFIFTRIGAPVGILQHFEKMMCSDHSGFFLFYFVGLPTLGFHLDL